DGIRDDLVTGVQTCALPIYVAEEPPRPDCGSAREEERQLRTRWNISYEQSSTVAYYYLVFCAGANHRATLNLPRIIVGSLPSMRSEERRVGKACRLRHVGGQ